MTTEPMQDEVMPVVQQAQEITVTNEATETIAGEILTVVKSLLKKVEEKFGPAVSAAHKAHKEAVAVKKSYEDPLKKAEKQIKAAIRGYRIMLEQARLKKQHEAEAEARRIAEEERKAKAAAEAAAGDKARAAVTMNLPVKPKPVPVVKSTPAPKGFHTRANWKARVVDIKALCAAVAEGKAAECCIEPNMKVLNSAARTQREDIRIPGVEAYDDTLVASSSSDITVTEF